MKKLELSRRAVLRGVGGFALALPALDVMLDAKPAYAQGAPVKRYVVMTSGQSTGQDSGQNVAPSLYVPATVGALKAAELRPAVAGLADIVDQFSIVSGLQIPSLGLDGYGSVPVAGKVQATHDSTLSPLLAGKAHSNGSYGANGATSDYLVAQQLGASSVYKQLVYRVQLDEFNGHYAEISYAAANKPVNNSVADPALAWQSLFGSFVPPAPPAGGGGGGGGGGGTPVGGGGPSAADLALQQKNLRRRSVLDAVMNSAKELSGRLGAADRRRLSDHLDQVRALEQRVALLSGAALPTMPSSPSSPSAPPPMTSTLSCSKPTQPGAFTKGANYNDEIKRGELLVDLITMAFACDLTRVASLLISFSMPMFRLPAHAIDVHEEGHSGSAADFLLSHKWHVGLFGRLVRNLKALPEGNGTVLDNTAVVFALEAGHGRDGQQGEGNYFAAHSTDNMVMLIGGGGGGKLRKGQHIRPAASGTHPNGSAKPRHPASVLISCMNAVGVPATTLGDVSGNVPELLL
ncbi:MAG: DUF1552 domain-containing protein [Myxococcales bacterium]|nr:DUF1552 domain-containing protein [Myxococcales bacterium]